MYKGALSCGPVPLCALLCSIPVCLTMLYTCIGSSPPSIAFFHRLPGTCSRLGHRQDTRGVLEEGPTRGSKATLAVQGPDGVKQRRKENLPLFSLHEASSSPSSSTFHINLRLRHEPRRTRVHRREGGGGGEGRRLRAALQEELLPVCSLCACEHPHQHLQRVW